MGLNQLKDTFATKVLHIDTNPHRLERETLLKVGEDVLGHTYLEEDPTVAEWARDCVPSRADVADYVRTLFPSASWIRRYNLHWMIGDVIAGMILSNLGCSKAKCIYQASLSDS